MSIGWAQTFALDLDQVRKLIGLYVETPAASVKEASEKIGVGGPKVEGLNAWLKYLGLRDPRTKSLTTLGTLLHDVDPELKDRGTLCILHYRLVSNPESTVWYEALNHFLPGKAAFSRAELRSYFDEQKIGDRSTKHLSSDIRLFLGTYTETSHRGLGDLGLLQKEGEDHFRTKPVADVNYLVLGFCMLDRWERGANESTISISRLLHEDGYPGLLFCLPEQDLRSKLRELESERFISVVRMADIDGISFGAGACSMRLLERYFGKNV